MRDRLTERVGDGIRYDNGKYIVTCYPKNDNLTPVDKLAAKLCDLEDKIENGAVIVPPCKVGDTVYYIGGIRHSIVKRATVEEIIANSCGVSDLLVNSENNVTFENSIDIFYFTREEAEKALAERSGE